MERDNKGRFVAKYNADEERKNAITKSKTKYMMNKEWCCTVCNGHNYTLAGKHIHLKSKKHQRNVELINSA